jgi:uncharacterized membrane protein
MLRTFRCATQLAIMEILVKIQYNNYLLTSTRPMVAEAGSIRVVPEASILKPSTTLFGQPWINSRIKFASRDH